MKLPDPRPPKWAVEAGMPTPEEGEEFMHYWERVGMKPHHFKRALDGLNDVTADIANLRLGSIVRLQMSPAFNRHVANEMRKVGLPPP